MKVILIIIAIVLVAAVVVAVGTYEFTFVHRMNKRLDPFIMTDFDKNYYGEFTDNMLNSSKLMSSTDHKHVFIKSFDGLKLNGHLYDAHPGNPLVIFFHGYHGSYLRDGYGTFRYCMEHNLNILMIEERSHCKSEGHIISFGINERKDAVKWVEYAHEIMPEGTKILLSGVSMGAATVMMSTDLLEDNDSVIGFIEDCGYTSPKAIIINTAKNMGFPTGICYPLTKIAVRLLGKINIEEAAAEESLTKISKPILFVHGDKDGFVPTAMCPVLFEKCTSKNKQMKIIPGAEHAIAALVDYPDFEKAVTDFLLSVDKELFAPII